MAVLRLLGGVTLILALGGVFGGLVHWSRTSLAVGCVLLVVGTALITLGFGTSSPNSIKETDALTDRIQQEPSPRLASVSAGLQAWYRYSLAATLVGVGFLATLVVAALHWNWVSGRIGGVLAPLGAVVVATSASAGAARTVIEQSRVSEWNRLEDAEGLLWKRFDEAAKQFSDEHFATRVAGVYSFVGLADDWIRHHQQFEAIGASDKGTTAECEIILHALCAQLRRNTHLDEGLTPNQVSDEALVNEAIMGQIGWHLYVDGDDSADNGLWSERRLLVDLRDTDLSDVRWLRVDVQGAVFKGADLYNMDLIEANLADVDFRFADLRKANLTGAEISSGTQFDNVIFDSETKWPPEVEILRSDGASDRAQVRLTHHGVECAAREVGDSALPHRPSSYRRAGDCTASGAPIPPHPVESTTTNHC
ncbi:pentapeptide repeat-containing protein [Mycobacterium sp. Aquia_213]|uniref:pentapeptide repeat-containing protein n=1 Tax=Mycobacterium sp. Aquia_213 TaxID=2991728 RepID=UPI002270C90E|nr:pentapeptide repeat-containing protein [Mycobacterium sp. Aquia_213]WAC90695.1 pentapeptide repeat-containing protein [Mycobacterium sp. Aquia_213]